MKREEDKADRRGRKTTSGMARPGVCQVPEGSGEQRKIEETGGEVICGAQNPPPPFKGIGEGGKGRILNFSQCTPQYTVA